MSSTDDDSGESLENTFADEIQSINKHVPVWEDNGERKVGRVEVAISLSTRNPKELPEDNLCCGDGCRRMREGNSDLNEHMWQHRDKDKKSQGTSSMWIDSILHEIQSFLEKLPWVIRCEFNEITNDHQNVCSPFESFKKRSTNLVVFGYGLSVSFSVWLAVRHVVDLQRLWCTYGFPWHLRIVNSENPIFNWQRYHIIDEPKRVSVAFGNLVEPSVMCERRRFHNVVLRLDHSMKKLHIYLLPANISLKDGKVFSSSKADPFIDSASMTPSEESAETAVLLSMLYGAVSSCLISFRPMTSIKHKMDADITLRLKMLPQAWTLNIMKHAQKQAAQNGFSNGSDEMKPKCSTDLWRAMGWRLEEVPLGERTMDSAAVHFNGRQLGSCLTLQITIRDHNADQMIELLERFTYKLSMAGIPVAYCNVETIQLEHLQREQARAKLINTLSTFECQYVLSCVLSWSDEILEQLWYRGSEEIQAVTALLRQLESCGCGGPPLLVSVLTDIFVAIELGNVLDFRHSLENQQSDRHRLQVEAIQAGLSGVTGFNNLAFLRPDMLNLPGLRIVRRVFVTPLRIVLRPPEHHMENRILREFDSDFALRVSFRDDDFRKLTFSHRSSFINSVVEPLLRNGIQMGLRLYEPVAASSSQFREHGVWFYARDNKGRDAATICDWMGDFEAIHNVATRMARKGQCLSSTRRAFIVRPEEERHMADVERSDLTAARDTSKTLIFTDGCGNISRELLEDVWASCSLRWHPSAIQIRYKGYKGMLCLDPALPGRSIYLRPSMNKFPCSSSTALEVIRGSRPMTVTLNRPFISILEFLGVPIYRFLEMQQTQLLELIDAFVNNHAAAAFILRNCWKSNMPLEDMLRAGWPLVADPFCIHLLFESLKGQLQCLKDKSNIAIHPNLARNLYGVADETGTLEYGEVFIQYTVWPFLQNLSDNSAQKSFEGDDSAQQWRLHVLEGPVVLTKCPCYHPGDVRRMMAVDRPQLRHIKDCVVFSTKGPRPMPYEMSGSDLDGDEFVAIWEPQLLFPENVEPYIYPDRLNQIRSANENRIVDEMGFFCHYIANDVVGTLSNAHLAFSDAKGLLSPQCLRLVERVSLALDSVKTGCIVNIKTQEKPVHYPDFMEKCDHKPSYESRKALGYLYRSVRQLLAIEDVKVKLCHVMGINKDSHWEIPGWRDCLPQATLAYEMYSRRLAHLMNQYGIRTECEIITGHLSKQSDYTMMRTGKDNVEMILEQQWESLVSDTRRLFLEQVHQLEQILGLSDYEDMRCLRYRLACAWFHVCYPPMKECESSTGQEMVDAFNQEESLSRSSTFYSFVWCIGNVIADAWLWLRDCGFRSPPKADSRDNHVLIDIINRHHETQGDSVEQIRSAALHYIGNWLNTIVECRLDIKVDSEPLVCECCLGKLFDEAFNYKSATDINELCDLPKPTVGSLVIAFIRRLILCPQIMTEWRSDGTLPATTTTSDLSLQNDNCNSSCSSNSCRFKEALLHDDTCNLHLSHETNNEGTIKETRQLVSPLCREATRVYMIAAINKDLCFLGLPCDPRYHYGTDSIRIDAPPEVVNITPGFYRFLVKTKGEEFKRMLQLQTKAAYIHIEYFDQTLKHNNVQPGQEFQMKVHYSGTLEQRIAMQNFLRDQRTQILFSEGQIQNST